MDCNLSYTETYFIADVNEYSIPSLNYDSGMVLHHRRNISLNRFIFSGAIILITINSNIYRIIFGSFASHVIDTNDTKVMLELIVIRILCTTGKWFSKDGILVKQSHGHSVKYISCSGFSLLRTKTSMPYLSSDPGTCYDESEKCEEFAKERKCVNHDQHEYANFCKKSCGLCGKSLQFLHALTP